MKKITRKKSQIATILTLIIALIFLFIVITINLGKVSHKKTVIDNACDSAALFMASTLGSIVNALKIEYDLLGYANENCTPDWYYIAGIITIIGGIIATVFTLGAAAPLLYVAIAATSIVAGSLIVASDVLIGAYTDPGLMREMQIKFQNMTAEQRIFEAGIQSALFSTIDDANFVPDLYDADRDGRKMANPDDFANLDKIPRFSHWYLQRLNYLPRIGMLIETFYHYLFTDPAVFRITTDGTPLGDATAASLYVGGVNIRSWLKGTFKTYIHDKLWVYGYGFPTEDEEKQFERYDINRTDDALDGLIMTIEAFESVAKDMYNSSIEDLIASFETWIGTWYNTDNNDDWYDQLGVWEGILNYMISVLEDRHSKVVACIDSCEVQARACDTWVCDTYDEDGVTCLSWSCSSYSCSGNLVDCCRNCANANCKPGQTCVTVTNGTQWCCDSGCKLRSGCSSTILSRINVLKNFRTVVQNIRQQIWNLADGAQASKANFWANRAIYAWKDVVLNESGAEVAAESPAHLVVVETDLTGFQFPYPHQEKVWDWFFFIPYPSFCKRVVNAEGQFGFRVARYDEDLAKTGPLKNFWRFRFRINPGLAENVAVNTLRRVADKFKNCLDQGYACTNLESMATQAEYNRLRNLAFTYGIVADVTANYGPGYTYDWNEITGDVEDGPGEAYKRNEDIYIIRNR